MTSPTVWFKASRCQCAAAIRRRAERDKLGPSCCATTVTTFGVTMRPSPRTSAVAIRPVTYDLSYVFTCSRTSAYAMFKA
jgi:hypothetical protein